MDWDREDIMMHHQVLQKDITTSSSTEGKKGLDGAAHAVTPCSSDVSSRGYVHTTTSFQEIEEAPYMEMLSSISK